MTDATDEGTEDTRSVVSTRSVSIAVYLSLIAVALLLGYDNWRTGMSWSPEGPEAGYFPFYLSVILGGASLFGLVSVLFTGEGRGETFVTRDQFHRVMQVFVPTLLFCLFIQWLGLYAASSILVAGFMWLVGRMALWKSLLIALVFSVVMFVTFDIAFDVIMPKGPLEAAFGY